MNVTDGKSAGIGWNTVAISLPVSRTKQPLLRAFGFVLKHLHAAFEQTRGRQFSHEALARMVRKDKPHLAFGGPTLWRWERGEVGSPDPLILEELAGLYGTDYASLLAVLRANRADPRLTPEEGRKILEGVSDDAKKGNESHQSKQSDVFNVEYVVSVAAQLLDTGDVLHQLAEEILRRQVTAVGLTPTGRDARDRTARRPSPRLHSKPRGR